MQSRDVDGRLAWVGTFNTADAADAVENVVNE